MLNLKTLNIALIGSGEKLLAREAKLRELGAQNLTVFSYVEGLKIEFGNFRIVMLVGLEPKIFTNLHKMAKAACCLVNTEDEKEYSDFFFQSFVKRGSLLISVSTEGKTPGTAKLIRDKISDIFPPEWEGFIDEISAKREDWKRLGKTYDEVNELTKEFVLKQGWL